MDTRPLQSKTIYERGEENKKYKDADQKHSAVTDAIYLKKVGSGLKS